MNACAHFDVSKVEVVRKEGRILTDKPGRIGAGSSAGGGNGGFQALNLAVQFGARRILLIGFDMRTDMGVHWHGRHPKGLNNPTMGLMAHWRAALNGAAQKLAAHGIEVINCSPVSTLTAFPIIPLKDVQWPSA